MKMNHPGGPEKTNPNKPNFKIGKMNTTFFTTKPYANKQRTMDNEHRSKQTQSNPILSRRSPQRSCIHLPLPKSHIPISQKTSTVPRAVRDTLHEIRDTKLIALPPAKGAQAKAQLPASGAFSPYMARSPGLQWKPQANVMFTEITN
jgi:hypothetical protein